MSTQGPSATTLPLAPSLVGEAARSKLMLIAAAVGLLTLSAKIQIPMWPVPMTMQTYVVLVIGMGYGTRLGVVSVASYIVLGAVGLPVFAGTPERGVGMPYLLGPTGGYLLGFLVAAGLCGALARRAWDRHFLPSLAAMACAHVLIFACGVAWLASTMGWERAFAVGVTPFIAATIIKTILAAASLPAAWEFARHKRTRL